ncbi:divalent metal cation transporter [Micromonospora polyrhachis]|uniref:Mn2+/Fe2+ NRAMP family transporter n=1 Tax=Micromonospora polyrhachis TaxID=1282883 RepID=A0A7W7SP33_9ACTN|nr:divalent metal cation transporter [Micromonospora polyrhachis]MBB4958342.1 Mn2+/Fe2+ NRAMP family transporter [Micromonospora polyrhachis]
MKKFLGITLGILTAIGGFVDIGDIVSSSEAGSRFGLAHTWVLVVGVIGICVYAEMAGRVTAVSNRPVFDLIRERLGPRVAVANLIGSYLVTLLTLAAEIGGVALALQLLSDVPYLVWVPLVALVLWLALWRVRFETLERIFGLAGLTLVVLVIAILWLNPPFGELAGQALTPAPPEGENWPTYWFFAIALFASAMTPYEVFFFSSGGVEERWTAKDLVVSRINVFVGFPLGGLLAFGFLATSAIVFHPLDVGVDTLGQAVLPAGLAFGKVGLALIILGVFAATFGAAMETSLSSGYAVAQYFGWSWGKLLRPRQAIRFHTVVLVSILLAVAALLTTIDPVQLTEYMLIFSAVVLPLTYLPILVVANDRGYLGDKVNGPFANTLGVVYLVIVMAAAVAAIPLMVMTGMGG